MRKQHFRRYMALVLCAAAVAVVPTTVEGASTAPTSRPLSIGFANFKTVVEQSKVGKQEQATFDGMKKQMESILSEKEKALNEMATKFNYVDYLDALSPEAETELKRKFRAQSQEYQQQQQQYYQSLQQANYKILEKLADAVAKAAKEVAKENKLDVIYNQEGAFYYAPEFDVSSLIVAKMDVLFEKEAKEQPAAKEPVNK
jgi:outer membrane protein